MSVTPYMLNNVKRQFYFTLGFNSVAYTMWSHQEFRGDLYIYYEDTNVNTKNLGSSANP